MENFLEFIKPELLILIPVLYFIGMGLKKSESIRDTRIPLLLGLCGIVLAVAYTIAKTDIPTYQEALMAAFVAVTQGILCAGMSVYVNNVIKQGQQEGEVKINLASVLGGEEGDV